MTAVTHSSSVPPRAMGPLALLAMICLASGALATMKPPVDVNLEADPDHIPIEGEILAVSFVFTTDTPVTLVEPEISSGRNSQGDRHWDVVMFDVPAEFELEPGSPRVVAAELQCNNPTEPMFVTYRAGPFLERKTFYLTPFLNSQAVEVQEDGLLGVPAWDPAMLRPEPTAAPAVAPRDRPEYRAELEARSGGAPDVVDEESSPATASVVRTAVGNIRYKRTPSWANEYSGADGVTVRLYDADTGNDDLLGTIVTDAWGNFVIDFVWLWDNDPDLYIEFEAANGKVWVMYPGGAPVTYRWSSAVKWNVGGDVVSFGVQEPPSFNHMPMLHACTQLSRAWRKVADMGYPGVDRVKVRMPDSDWPHYKGGSLETIFMSEDRIWEDGTLWHEYGHHLVHELGAGNGSDYCNSGSRCDYINGDDECRHCNWCQETAGDAWNEGFPSWFGDVMTRVIHDSYAVLSGEPIYPLDYEVVGICGSGANGNDTYDDPNSTEGILAALLRDLEDGGAADVDSLGGGVGRDALNLAAADVFDVMAAFNPTTPAQFLAFFANQHPGQVQNTWFTARNNGYNFDGTPPGAVQNLLSPSHNAIPSPDATIAFTWDEPADDISGVGDYSVWIGPTPQPPDYSADGIGDATSLVTNPLPAGVYWFSIRARDRAGNWSDDWALYGPLAIRDPYPANVLPGATASFQEPIVPTQEPTDFVGIAPLPTFLPPAPTGTYLNLCVGNDGESATEGAFVLQAHVDGALTAQATMPTGSPVGPGSFGFAQNLGPHPVRGGRHTLSLVVDATEVLGEPDENDNTDQRQWVWSPYLHVPGTSRLDSPPPRPYAGWFVEPPLFQAPNCVGMRMLVGSSESAAVYLLPQDLDDDYSLLSHAASTGPDNGFSYLLSEALSFRAEGRLDAVIVAPDAAGGGAWDVGVFNHNGSGRQVQGDWLARCIESVELPVETVVQVDWDETEAMALFHSFYPPRTAPDQRVIEVIADPSVGPLNVAVYPNNMDHAGLLDHQHYGRTGRLGTLAVSFEQSTGQWTIAVWRDPADQPDGAMPLEPAFFTIELMPERPNLTPATVAGWHAPLVPRPAGDGSPISVPAPTTLVGDASQTWLNAAVRNAGAHEAGQTLVTESIDGAVVSSQTYPTFAAYTTAIWNGPSPTYVRGGRHTLSLRLDPGDAVEEELEDDNSFGAQWAWIPSTVPVGGLVTRPAPPDATGGWDAVVEDGPVDLVFNVDGLRTPALQPSGDDGHWLALATVPGPASDVDLRLYEALDSAQLGFTDLELSSIFGPEQTDYVLANFRATSPRSFDVGVVGAAGAADYAASVVASTFLASDPQGTYGTFELGPDEVLSLHEVELSAGGLSVTLAPASGAVDWGLTLHRANLPLHSKNTPLSGGESWVADPGEAEQIQVEVPEPGFYCLAVWKVSTADTPLSGAYRLVFDSVVGVEDVPGIVPDRTEITAIAPNPFNPRTTVRFDLARSGATRLQIYDVQGRLVRTLVDQPLAAGRHEVAWNGDDDHGRRVHSGVFLARLVAGDQVSQSKLVLVK